jgi:hypothetical protein
MIVEEDARDVQRSVADASPALEVAREVVPRSFRSLVVSNHSIAVRWRSSRDGVAPSKPSTANVRYWRRSRDVHIPENTTRCRRWSRQSLR